MSEQNLTRLPVASRETIKEFIVASRKALFNRVDAYYEGCLVKGMLFGLYGLQLNLRSPYQRRLKTVLPSNHPAWMYFLNSANLPPGANIQDELRSMVDYDGLYHYFRTAEHIESEISLLN